MLLSVATIVVLAVAAAEETKIVIKQCMQHLKCSLNAAKLDSAEENNQLNVLLHHQLMMIYQQWTAWRSLVM